MPWALLISLTSVPRKYTEQQRFYVKKKQPCVEGTQPNKIQLTNGRQPTACMQPTF